jgi:putative ABC transport system permease protein
VLRFALGGVRSNLTRFAAMAVAIVFAVGFLAAGLLVVDSTRRALTDAVSAQHARVDAVVRPARADDRFAPSSLPPALVAAIDGLDGVEAAAGALEGQLSLVLADGTTFDRSARGRLWIDDDDLNPLDIVEGRVPSAPGEIAIDRSTATHTGFAAGDRVRLNSARGLVEAEVVGITRAGNVDALDAGGTISLPAATAFDLLTGGTQEFSQVLVRGRGLFVDEDALVRQITTVLPKTAAAQTGTSFVEQRSDDSLAVARDLRTAMLVAWLLVLVVCGFAISTTFRFVLAHDAREIITLRSVGATPKQVRRAVRREGLIVGIPSCVVGALAGIAGAHVLRSFARPFGMRLPDVGLQVSPVVLVVAALAGVVVTVISTSGPARRAARAPLSASNDAAAWLPPTVTPTRTTLTALLCLGGSVALVVGKDHGGPAVVVAGAALLLAGVFLGTPLLVVACCRTILSPIASIGLPERLARDNTRRSPRRTATAAQPLLIGVLVVTVVTIAGSSVRDWSVGQITRLSSTQPIVHAELGSLDADLVADLRRVDGVADVALITSAPAVVDEQPDVTFISTGDLDEVERVAGVTAAAGNLADLRAGGLALTGPTTDDEGQPLVGQVASLVLPDGTTHDLPIVAVLDFEVDEMFVGAVVSEATFATLYPAGGDQNLAYVNSDAHRYAEVNRQLESLTEPFGTVEVVWDNMISSLVDRTFDAVVDAVTGILVFTLAVASIVILDALSLAVLQRRGELALLRVVGMMPTRITRMIRGEAVLIALLGTAIGMTTGVVVGWALDRAISIDNPTVSVDRYRLVIMFVLGVLVGVVASLTPAWRASRFDVRAALDDT